MSNSWTRREQELRGNYEYQGFGEDQCMCSCVCVREIERETVAVTLISWETLRIHVTQPKHVGQNKPMKQHFLHNGPD